MEAEITICYKTCKEAETIVRAVSPDNLEVPLGLSIRTFNRRNVVISKIICRKGLETLISTINDLLECIQAAERAVKSAMSR